LTNALTEAGITWQQGLGNYNLHIVLNPRVSGGNYFAWDFSDIDESMGLQGLKVIR